jgi:hypothetical protein
MARNGSGERAVSVPPLRLRSVYQSAAGLAVFPVISGKVGLSLYDGWGISATGRATMWRYKMQIAASALT